ncbi:hypothetical protein EV06_1827 [Prochlorococcus sp. MIT 0602]|nr:hypothetical protein EV06_1827 [Prochlorococcus sp. MIT 0602]KGG15803.1 hypothetical protein EV07_1769 [Prochlorococcus sp. MIT 0603]
MNQHSLVALELWLRTLGAEQNTQNPCLWIWKKSQWSAEIMIQQDELTIVWSDSGMKSQFSFPYGLPRQDIEAALKHGP